MIQHTRQGAVDVLVCDGALCADELDPLVEELNECLDDGQPRIVLDLTAAPLIDSQGLELLVDALERCQRRSGSLKLAGVNPLCREVLRVTDVCRRLELHEDTRSAVRSFM